MESIPKQPSDDTVIAVALKLIDPTGTLVPGTHDYDTIKLMIQGWIHQYGQNRTLYMARMGSKHIEGWRKFL